MQGARGFTATSWSLRGRHRAFAYAEEVACAVAQAAACRTCAGSSRRRHCAIVDVAYGWRLAWSRCTVTFDVYCDCPSS